MKLVLTRHTTTEWNSTGRIQGQTDISLSSQGEQEARELAEQLSEVGVDFIMSSDLKRAKKTAEIISSRLNIPLLLDAGLRECSFGSIEGMTKQEVIEQYGFSIAATWDDQHLAYDFRPFGGEHRDDVLRRHIAVARSLADEPENTDKVFLFVGHGRGLITLLASLGYPPNLKRGEYRVVEFNP